MFPAYLSAHAAEEEGLTVEARDPTNTLVEPIDPTTGNRLPAVQLIPDPGFANHPGKSVWGPITEMIAGKREAWPKEIADLVLPAVKRQLAESGLLSEEELQKLNEE